MKQELRCHAVLCPSENKARAMAQRLQERLHQALVDFRREKISKQNARLSLANSVYDNPTMPYRKILLHTGSSNYRPPHERGKSAPKLKAIEEEDVIVEEEEDEDDDGPYPMSAPPFASTSPSIMRRSASEPSTEVTSLASEYLGVGGHHPDVGVLVDLEDDDQDVIDAILNQDKSQTPCFVPMDGQERAKSQRALSAEASKRLVATFDDDEDEEDEEDEVINYLPATATASAGGTCVTLASVTVHDSSTDEPPDYPVLIAKDSEVDSAAPVSPDSNKFSTRSSSVRSKESDPAASNSQSTPVHAASSGARHKLDSAHDADSIGEEEDGRRSSSVGREQDAISDESGYSEESNPSTVGGLRRSSQTKREESHSGNTTIVNLNVSSLPRPSKFDKAREAEKCDKSDSSPSRLSAPSSSTRVESPIQCDLTVHSAALMTDYKETAATSNGGVDFLQNRITEFCINI